jgi:hypothetical protein
MTADLPPRIRLWAVKNTCQYKIIEMNNPFCAKLRPIIVLLLLVPGVSCSTYDSEYRELAAVAETNPKPQAIVGMWHRRASDGWGMQVRESYLFNRDGTGLLDYHHRDPLVGTEDKTMPFTWTYAGGGIWKTKYTDPDPAYSYIPEWRISQGKLLLKGGLGHSEVMERVAPQ